MNKLRPEDALRILRSARPDQVEAVELPDGSMEIHFMPTKPAKVSEKTGKWAKVAEELSREAPLTGIGEEFLKHTKRFRKSLVIKSPVTETE